uniref:Uncharacterized protein n=1 Tax=Romanomermis culicivorax TaxID=13658 RepID=A0A915K6A0_ROMCU
VTLASLEALRRDFLSKIKIEALISGRIDLQVAIDRFDHFVKHLELNGGHISDLEINWPMVLQLEK